MIQDHSFGKIVVNNTPFTRDIKIINGTVIPNWWRKRGHLVEVDDIHDILQAKPKIVILGKGDPGLMKSSRSLQKSLQTNKIELIEENTPQAIQRFNRLFKDGINIAAGFHISC